MELSTQTKEHFDSQGYLFLPAMLEDEMGWISHEFENNARSYPPRKHLNTRRTMNAFIERHERLATLLDHSLITGLFDLLLGPDWAYFCSEGNVYSGDTGWHSDSDWVHGTCIKLILYLDELTADTGALRVIPGTHRRDPALTRREYRAAESPALGNKPAADVPCLTLASNPGDVVLFNTNLLHAALGGGCHRRMLAMQFWSAFRTPAQFAELDKHMRNWSSVEALHSELLYRTGPSSRLAHLHQVSERHLAHPNFKTSPTLNFFRTKFAPAST